MGKKLEYIGVAREDVDEGGTVYAGSSALVAGEKVRAGEHVAIDLFTGRGYLWGDEPPAVRSRSDIEARRVDIFDPMQEPASRRDVIDCVDALLSVLWPSSRPSVVPELERRIRARLENGR